MYRHIKAWQTGEATCMVSLLLWNHFSLLSLLFKQFCQLCALVLHHLLSGRSNDATQLVKLFQDQKKIRVNGVAAVCVVAGAGLGKSCFSIDIGWKMSNAGMCPGKSKVPKFRGEVADSTVRLAL